jgi:mono/diheme cytochrome c family protein
LIKDVYTSCGCTVPTLPSQPWVLAPGAGGNLDLTINLRGKIGSLVKTATLETGRGLRRLTFQIIMPEPPRDGPERERNRQLATANRQAVFAGDCARCHVAPALGRTGEALYQAACGICHDAAPRAAMVPDLALLDRPVDWKTLIAAGKPETLMPAFAAELGGPLNRQEIDGLAGVSPGKIFAGAPAT